ncbi:MATE family efflux transporter [Agathobaculum sp.]|uniref:MATE family efflux transporter n=1 Tax=Agathobaculum sp. TaxID=2048138 RepID=UPI002A80DF5E|nr:MATE family efflux transporter [Agathobaculum sp.]MDY3617454.1 MATE family efflux transporter [Agathobaculum sp.]
MAKTTDMTAGNPTKLIARFAFPLILTNIGQQLYQITDAAIVGRGIGMEALAALGATDWLYWLVLWAVQAMTQGFSVLFSQCFGSQDREKMRKTITMSILLCAVIGTGLTVLSIGVSKPLLLALSTPDNILDQAFTYLSTMYAGTLIVIAYNMSAAFLRSVGDGKSPLIAMGIAGTLNVGLDIVFVVVFKWGIRGAALATLLAQLAAFLYCLAEICKNEIFHFSRPDWMIDYIIIKKLIYLGIPLALQQQVVVIGGIIAQWVINGCGFLFVAGFTATNKLHGLLDCSASAFGFAASTYIGQNWGAKRMDRIRDGVRKTLMLSVLFSLVLTVIMLLFGRQIVSLFISSSAENAAQVLNIAYEYLVVMSLFLFSAYIMHTFRATLQAMGTALAPTAAGFVEFAGRVGVALLLPRVIGAKGLYFIDGAAWLSSAIFLLAAYVLFMAKKRAVV